MTYRVEGLVYPNEEQAIVVAARFAGRYGRDIPVNDDKGETLFHVTAKGKKRK